MPASFSIRGLRPLAERAIQRRHGGRLRYLAGSRCGECRSASTNYEKSRLVARKEGGWNGLVPAATARAHMAALSTRNVVRRTAADVTGLAD